MDDRTAQLILNELRNIVRALNLVASRIDDVAGQIRRK